MRPSIVSDQISTDLNTALELLLDCGCREFELRNLGLDSALDADPRWGIAAVSLRSAETVEALRRQQGRYTLAVLDETRSFRCLDAHRAALGPGEEAAVRRQLADPTRG